MNTTYCSSYPNATPEAELGVLADIYRIAIQHYEEANAKEKGGPDTAPDDARKESNHVSRSSIIPG